MSNLIRALLCGAVMAFGPMAVASNEPFPRLYNSANDANAKPLSARESLDLMALPDGLVATVFASEPDIMNPIAMAWDAAGRIWVAENFTYAERARRFDLSLRDRVTILEDTDDDGVADTRTVFTDSIQMLTSVEVGHGGVWLMCPPQLLFIPDANGDDIPDGEPQVVLDGFTVAANNYHNFANGLRWGPDGWLYGRCGGSCPATIGVPGTPTERRIPMEGGIWRYHPTRKVAEVVCHGTTNPWGHDWDAHGEGFFINTVNGHLWQMIPGAHFPRPFGESLNPRVFSRIGMVADHYHFDTNRSWMESRDGKANDFGGGHAHSGMMIYQANNWPEPFQDKLFTLNMHGLRANVERLEPNGSGFTARHEDDQFLTQDSWFRGIDIQQGPSGAAYVLDWSDTGECHEHTGVHRLSGRIYRIAATGNQDSPPTSVEEILKHPNVWFERQYRRQLATHRGLSDTERRSLIESLQSDEAAALRLRALWALRQAGFATHPLLTSLLEDPDERLRAWAIRLLMDSRPLDTILGPTEWNPAAPIEPSLLDQFARLAEHDPSPRVRLELASILQRLPIHQRLPIAAPLASREKDATDANLPHMVWFGVLPLADQFPDQLVSLAHATQWPNLTQWIARSTAMDIHKKPEPINALLRGALATPEKRSPILKGLRAATRGMRRAPKPDIWDAFVRRANSDAQLAQDIDELTLLFGDGRALDKLKLLALDGNAEFAARASAVEALIVSQGPELREFLEGLLPLPGLNKIAVRGLTRYEDPEIGRHIVANYERFFRPQERPAAIEALCARPTWARALLEAVRSNAIPKTDISPYHARQIRALGVPELTKDLESTWGIVSKTPDALADQIRQLRTQLSNAPATAAPSAGRAVYERLCAMCHTLFGSGNHIGPDLTGSGRHELDYLLENIVAPNAVVPIEYQVHTISLADGRTLLGMIVRETEDIIELQTLAEPISIPKAAIDRRQPSNRSLMPEGLLQFLSAQEVRDLIAYLQAPRQVPLPTN